MKIYREKYDILPDGTIYKYDKLCIYENTKFRTWVKLTDRAICQADKTEDGHINITIGANQIMGIFGLKRYIFTLVLSEQEKNKKLPDYIFPKA